MSLIAFARMGSSCFKDRDHLIEKWKMLKPTEENAFRIRADPEKRQVINKEGRKT